MAMWTGTIWTQWRVLAKTVMNLRFHISRGISRVASQKGIFFMDLAP